jgi:hypothetical protein
MHISRRMKKAYLFLTRYFEGYQISFLKFCQGLFFYTVLYDALIEPQLYCVMDSNTYTVSLIVREPESISISLVRREVFLELKEMTWKVM